MSSELAPEHFFDLTHFAHATLFEGCDYVWEALSRITEYLNSLELGRIEVEIPESTILVNRDLISIGAGSVVEPGAYIKGPCVIGRNCQIRHGAYIRGEIITGDAVIIGHATETKHSIFLDGSQAAHFAYVGDCILGNRVNLGAGTKCANLKLDHTNIVIRHHGKRLDTGLRKFGSIMGDDSSVGCNSVPNPGTILGKQVRAYACANFGGVIPATTVVRHPQPEAAPL